MSHHQRLLMAALVAMAATAATSIAATASTTAAGAANAAPRAGDKQKAAERGKSGEMAAPAGLLAPLSDGETVLVPPLDERLPRPDSVLGYPLGSRFTHQSNLVRYFEALAAASPRVKTWEYGRTYEGRPLQLMAISTPENLAHLDDIQKQRHRLSEPQSLPAAERDKLAKRLPVVVWLAFGVHGDETSSPEAAMLTAYVMAAAQGEMGELLDSTIVLIDPLANPDGHERYVHAYEQRQGVAPDGNREAAEHYQPWPGGRPNHYLVDLNRDWAWATQQETRSRIAAYRSWEPQVYVDFHEMGAEASYFFPPPSEPVHPRIDHRVLSWLEVFGRANAEAFDRQGWLYYKAENYDLFYPGYGDSYPSLHGAVGMTYEVAGGGRGGLAITRADGTTLTLADRVGRHLTAALATLRAAERNGRRLLQDYVASRLKASSDPPRLYLWPADQPEAPALAELLALHGARVEQLAGPAEMRVQSLTGSREETSRRFAAGTYLVSSAQPLGPLVQALLDREAPMPASFIERQRQRFEDNREPEFYDITAWSLPLAFNLRLWLAAPGSEPPEVRMAAPAASGIAQSGESGDLGYLVAPQGIASYRLAAELGRRRIHYRVALAPLVYGGATYPRGTLFIPRHGNPETLPEKLAELLREDGLAAHGLSSSFDIAGLSLGSNEMPALRTPRVGLLAGDGVDAASFGFLWHLLDRQVGMACDRLDIDRLRPALLAHFDVLILPNGTYAERLGERARGALDEWIKEGGELVAVGGDTAVWLHDHEMTSFKPWKAPASDPESEGSEEKALGERDIATPGAIFATRLSAHSPLTLGVPSSPPVLVEGATVMMPSGDPRRDVLVVANQEPLLAGFAWPEARQRLAGSLLVGFEPRGSGSVVLFVQEPDFRLFWRGTEPLLLNAVLWGPSLGLAAGRN